VESFPHRPRVTRLRVRQALNDHIWKIRDKALPNESCELICISLTLVYIDYLPLSVLNTSVYSTQFMCSEKLIRPVTLQTGAGPFSGQRIILRRTEQLSVLFFYTLS